MASRPIISPYEVLSSASMSTSLTSDITVIQNTSMISYDVSWENGSSPVGLFEVQVSNSYTQNVDGSDRDSGNWTTLTLSTTPTVSGNSGNGFIDVLATAGYAIRLVYTRESGSGELTATICGKVQ